ncbi:MAG: cytochrome c biogenesis protein CcsA [Alphaproteobacteria bacterium]|nr:cytochrome c biogenesis protein CcsA [Alphaproteobacteria bacterium]
MKNILLFLLAILFLLPFPAAAQERPDLSDFQRLPIVHEGRVQPLDSFARLYLKQISGRETLDKLSAVQWLAETVFTPEIAAEKPVFRVVDKFLKERLKLNERRKLFSLRDLEEGLQITAPQIQELLQSDPGRLTAEQQGLMDLHEKVVSFLQILRSLSLIHPLAVELPEKYRALSGAPPYSYESLLTLKAPMEKDLRALVARKGDNPELYTGEEKKLTLLAYNLDLIRDAARGNQLLRILPAGLAGEEWVAPWALLESGQGSPASASYFILWKDMAAAYRSGNHREFEKAAVKARVFITKERGEDLSSFRMNLEILFNLVRPLRIALVLYGFAILGSLIPIHAGKAFEKLKLHAPTASFMFMIGGLALHGTALMARILILQRPPVGTLYESVLFVSFLCALAGVGFSRMSGLKFIRIIGVLCGFGLLAISPFFSSGGESMDMLAAVLNTSFWLSTHVICIMLGYAACIFSAALAHGWLILRARKMGERTCRKLQAAIYLSSLLALFLMAVGTVLGGLWADQSWGRFWGWDPKENGALLIVLWIVWLHHGRLGGNLRGRSFIAAVAALNIVVALAWFGVNLLNVGLHSYGFISGIAAGLAGFCLAETLLIGALWFFAGKEKAHEQIAL